MAEAPSVDDAAKFVALIEQHIDVLLKPQSTENKKKKDEAVCLIIPKWEELSKVKLSQAALFKKISNLKAWTKSALKAGKQLNEWQNKMLNLMVLSSS